MKSIELSDTGDRRIVVRVDQVTAVAEWPDVDVGCLVCVMGGMQFVVKEDLDTVLAKMASAEQP
jgi:uncharacterized protein YlzI (FlbEa/FlbD family)